MGDNKPNSIYKVFIEGLTMKETMKNFMEEHKWVIDLHPSLDSSNRCLGWTPLFLN
jgi:hypothetical protein